MASSLTIELAGAIMSLMGGLDSFVFQRSADAGEI
jgi:hypothetical protein